ncbi:MAG: hypothetical protein ACP5GY_00810 [Vulcanisaeta sp.]
MSQSNVIERLGMLNVGVRTIFIGYIYLFVLNLFQNILFGMIESSINTGSLLILVNSISGIVSAVLSLLIYVLIMLRAFSLLEKAYPEDYRIGKAGVGIMIIGLLTGIIVDILFLINPESILTRVTLLVRMLMVITAQLFIAIALYRLGYYSDALKYGALLTILSLLIMYPSSIFFVLLYPKLLVYVEYGYRYTGISSASLDLAAALGFSASIEIVGLGTILFGLRNANRTITKLIIDLSRDSKRIDKAL